jgi:hypothetical protein
MLFSLIPFWMQSALLAGAVSLVIGGVGGWRVEKAFSDERWYKAKSEMAEHEAEVLRARIEVVNDAAADDGRRAEVAAAEAAQAKGERDALAAQVTDGACFGPADADRVLRLWKRDREQPVDRQH